VVFSNKEFILRVFLISVIVAFGITACVCRKVEKKLEKKEASVSAPASVPMSQSKSSLPSFMGPTEATKIWYHGNLRSKVFHAPGCSQYNCRKCKALLGSMEQAKQNGFRPHRCVKQ